MIKETTCYYAVCDTCGNELDEDLSPDHISATEWARDHHEWFVTNDGLAICSTDDPEHRNHLRKNLELFTPEERQQLLDFYPGLLEETGPS